MLYLFSFIILIIGSFFTSLCIIGNLSVNIVFSIFSIILVFIFLILNIKKVISLEVKRTNIIPVFFILIYFTIYFCFNKNFSQNYLELFKMYIYMISIYCFFKIGLEIKSFNTEKLKKIYIIFLKLNLAIAVLQLVLFNVFGIVLQYNTQRIYDHGSLRPAGLFTEPSFIGAYSIILLSLSVKEYIDKKKLILITSLILITTGSAVSILVSILLIFKFLFIKRKNKKIITLFLIILLCLPTATSIFLNTNQGMRIRSLIDNTNYDGSAIVRVYKGIYIFNQFDFKKKLFGVNFGNYNETDEYIDNSGKYYDSFKGTGEYMSGVGLELVHFGLIGFLILNVFYAYVLKANKNIFFFIAFEILRMGSNLSYMSFIMILFLIMTNLNMEN